MSTCLRQFSGTLGNFMTQHGNDEQKADIAPGVGPEFWRGMCIGVPLSALLWWGIIESAAPRQDIELLEIPEGGLD